jgi:CheY-specific phosphatase CheX
MGDELQNRVSVPTASLIELTEESMKAVFLLDGLAQEATAALFSTYGMPVEQDGPVAARGLQSASLVSIIGFSSHALSGSLILSLPQAVAERTLPVEGASLADWSGELANQLLGRLKNQLLKYQVVINMSLPVVLSGDSLKLLATARQITRYYSFSSELGKVLIRLDMEFGPTLELVRLDDDARPDAVDEGELLLF